MIVCLEGIDASGKATQAKLLAEKFKTGVPSSDAQVFSFPTYGEHPNLAPAGQVVADHLHGKWHVAAADGAGEVVPHEFARRDAFVFQCVMTVNKYELAPTIRRVGALGRLVILDRYWPSAYAYGLADGLSPGWLMRIHESLPQPDCNFLLDVPAPEAAARRPERRDRYERRSEDYFGRVRLNYLQLWRTRQDREGRDRWVIVDGRAAVDVVHRAIRFHLDRVPWPQPLPHVG